MVSALTTPRLCEKAVDDISRCSQRFGTKTMCKYHYDSSFKKGKFKHVTTSELEKMKELYLMGKSSSQVGKILGYTKPTVLRNLRVLGIVRTEEQCKGSKYVWGFDYVPKTPLQKRIFSSPKYAMFRKRMFERDKWTCVTCGYKGSKIQLDHIKPRSIFPELIMDESNVRTLCIPCHKETDTYGIKIYHKYIKGNK